jgi:hypothetical protein
MRSPPADRLLAAYREWAEARGFVPHVHDARFRGFVRGVETIIETGIRDTGIYRTYVTLALVTHEQPRILASDAGDAKESERMLALRTVLRGDRSIALRVEPDCIEIATYGKTPDELEAVIDKVVRAWAEGAPGVGPYR